jgi:hypothetical protein
LDKEYLAVLETMHGTLYYLNLNRGAWVDDRHNRGREVVPDIVSAAVGTRNITRWPSTVQRSATHLMGYLRP